ncbi:MAG: head-tail adaptor protein [Proteobacteria bacterium]|nr:head-tail adaptor protein [Pseudomonadota bacterium]
MWSRRARKRIEIWQSLSDGDGISGYTTSDELDELITSSWANISTLSNNRKYLSSASDLGVDDISNSIVVKVRKRNDITYNARNQFIMYQGIKYIIQTAPIDINFNDSYVDFIATKEMIEDVGIITPFGSYPLYVNYVNRVENNDGSVSSKSCLESYIDNITIEPTGAELIAANYFNRVRDNEGMIPYKDCLESYVNTIYDA